MTTAAPERHIYLTMTSLEEARERLFDHFHHLAPIERSQRIPTPEAVGRVLAEPVTAAISSPAFNAAAMDGIAVRAADTFGASQVQPRTLEMEKTAFFVNTGNPLPAGTDAVIMIEHVQEADAGRVVIEAPVFPWANVRKIGEDIVATELLFTRNHRVTPYCIGALLSGGVFSVPVREKPRVLVIPTGSEVVDWAAPGFSGISEGQVIDSNSYVLEALVAAWGGEAVRHAIIPDNPEAIRQAIASAVEMAPMDLVLTVGGSSAGSRDFTRSALEALGRVLVHGVTIMPGKPVVMGDVGGKPVIGVPGYPVSAIVVFEQFVGPLMARMLGVDPPERARETVVPARDIPSRLGVEEFVRVKLGAVGDRVVATPLPRGAGSITTLTEADGMVRIPVHVEGLKADAPVAAELLRPRSAVGNTLVVVGSHDNTLDVLADQIRAENGRLTLSSSHVGSMGGLMAVKRGVCHLAGSHLLDTADGTYNVSYIRRYLRDIPVCLVHLVNRDQGLMVAKGNPKSIGSIEDLARKDIRFVNRQGGSGTRILLDYRMGQLGMAPADINGYASEEFTHMAVAVAVLSGRVDVGLGILAAAKALDLDFIPVVTEQYDLIIPSRFMETANMELLLQTIRSDRFKERVNGLGGYHTERTGTLLMEFHPEA